MSVTTKNPAGGAVTGRIPLMAGNWKMNLNHLEAIALVQRLAFALDDKDFDQVEVYDAKLSELEEFIAELSSREMAAHEGVNPAGLLAAREDELRLQQRFARQLKDALTDLPVPDFLRVFLSRARPLGD